MAMFVIGDIENESPTIRGLTMTSPWQAPGNYFCHALDNIFRLSQTHSQEVVGKKNPSQIGHCQKVVTYRRAPYLIGARSLVARLEPALAHYPVLIPRTRTEGKKGDMWFVIVGK